MADTYTTEAIACGLSDVATERGDADGSPLERVRHLKRGTEYEVLGEAEAQVSYDRIGAAHRVGRPIWDESRLTVYRCVKTAKLWVRFTDEFRDGRFETIAPASPPASVTGTEGDHRELRAVMRRLLAAKNAGGIEDAETQAQALGHAVDTCIGQIREFLAAPSHPGEADRVRLGELERLSKAATPGLCTIWQNTPFLLRDDTSNAWALTGTYTRAPEQAKANAEFLKALWNAYRAGHLVPASLPALGTGEGSGGASPTGSGWSAEPEPVPVSALAGDHPSRGWQPIATAPKGGMRLGAPLVFLWLYYPYKHEADRQKLGWWDCITNRWDHFPRLDYETQPTHWMPRPPAPCDGSGEAGETEGLDPKGDSAVTEGQAPSPLPHPQAPNTLSEVEEARALLEKEKRAYNGNPSEIVKYLRWRADLVLDDPEMRQELLTRADRIEAALASTEPHARSEEATDAR